MEVKTQKKKTCLSYKSLSVFLFLRPGKSMGRGEKRAEPGEKGKNYVSTWKEG